MYRPTLCTARARTLDTPGCSSNVPPDTMYCSASVTRSHGGINSEPTSACTAASASAAASAAAAAPPPPGPEPPSPPPRAP
eukprot:51320-Chlamydomonas_euryale.AAC.1